MMGKSKAEKRYIIESVTKQHIKIEIVTPLCLITKAVKH
jgi:hypothetical protein